MLGHKWVCLESKWNTDGYTKNLITTTPKAKTRCIVDLDLGLLVLFSADRSCSAAKSLPGESAQPNNDTDESITLTFLLAKGTPKCADVGTNTRPSGKSQVRFEISDLGQLGCNLQFMQI